MLAIMEMLENIPDYACTLLPSYPPIHPPCAEYILMQTTLTPLALDPQPTEHVLTLPHCKVEGDGMGMGGTGGIGVRGMSG